MDWQCAKEKTLGTWRGIQEMAATADSLDLLVEINAVHELCRKAREEAGGPWHRCDYCLAYQQFGGCRGISARMSERVAAGDREGFRELVDEFLENLEAMEVPPPGAGAAAVS